jgi:succinate dehydrogenase/fumarate reductase flavoprotein subunit
MAVGLTACTGLDGDSRDTFIADIIASGQGLANPELAETLVDGSRDALAFLESLGHTFVRNQEGHFSDHVITRAGGHTQSRTLASSGSGIGMGQVLRAAMEKYRIAVFEDTFVTELILEGKRLCGVHVLDLSSGMEYGLSAKAVVLATGGGSWLFYPQTSNNLGSTGDGYALAFHAGAELMDMEQVQAIPFGITHPQAYRGLICGEPVVAGPAGRIIDGAGNVVLDGGIHAMGRATVVRHMAEPIQKGCTTVHGGLLLDLQPNLLEDGGRAYRERIRATGIFDTVLPAYGKKAFEWEEPWEVTPTAHFFMGGVKADKDGTSTVAGLYVAGEVMGGVHGGNRLGSTALTEILVFGLRAGRAAAVYAGQITPALQPIMRRAKSPLIGRSGQYRPIRLCHRLQKLMWHYAGLVRSKEGLHSATQEVQKLKEDAKQLHICNEEAYNTELRDALELGFMLDTATMLLRSALLREESRGAHLRSDFPEANPHFEKNMILYRDESGNIAHALRGRGR